MGNNNLAALWKKAAKANRKGWRECFSSLVKAIEDNAYATRQLTALKELEATHREVEANKLTAARAWSALWKRTAKENRRRANSHADRLVYAMGNLLSLSAERDELRAVVDAVEWITGPKTPAGNTMDYCPWCGGVDIEGHAPDCQRQRALGLERER
jgi:hypothetical protein